MEGYEQLNRCEDGKEAKASIDLLLLAMWMKVNRPAAQRKSAQAERRELAFAP